MDGWMDGWMDGGWQAPAPLTTCLLPEPRKPQFCFAVMTGPLMWSIVAMRNSLVFHDGDKITTLMMHASPAISAW